MDLNINVNYPINYVINYAINIGKNAKHNWQLIDNSQPDDIWFHVDSYPSSHVIINLQNINSCDFIRANKNIIQECALICKSKSKAKDEKKVKIIYTTISNIKKGKDVGSVHILNNPDCKSIYI